MVMTIVTDHLHGRRWWWCVTGTISDIQLRILLHCSILLEDLRSSLPLLLSASCVAKKLGCLCLGTPLTAAPIVKSSAPTAHQSYDRGKAHEPENTTIIAITLGSNLRTLSSRLGRTSTPQATGACHAESTHTYHRTRQVQLRTHPGQTHIG